MKRHIFIAAIAIMTTLCACEKQEDNIRRFVAEFERAVKLGDTTLVSQMYPDINARDSIVINVNTEKLELKPYDRQGGFLVKIDDTSNMVVTPKGEDTYVITHSHGLIRYPDERLSFAKSVGQYDPDLTDTDNRSRMNNAPFNEYINARVKQANPLKTTGLKIVSSPEFMYESGSGYFIVTNTAPYPVPGADYDMVVKYLIIEQFEGSDHYEDNIMPGRDIDANGSVKFEYMFGARYIAQNVRINYHPTPFTPSGNEYNEFMKLHQQP